MTRMPARTSTIKLDQPQFESITAKLDKCNIFDVTQRGNKQDQR